MVKHAVARCNSTWWAEELAFSSSESFPVSSVSLALPWLNFYRSPYLLNEPLADP